MGASYFDYVIADSVVVPISHQVSYSEKIVFLPNSYQANDASRNISDKTFTKAECGLPSKGFIFCCFNNNYKITPEVFDPWMRILKSIDGSVLWLFEENATAAVNLRKEAAVRGIDPARLAFAKRMPLSDHLARHRLADLFLDTLPCNAHTTASDALWTGLPVLTQIGEMFAGRVAASLLNAINLPELIVETPEQYERLAIELATHPEKLRAVKSRLAENRLTAPLFDTGLFTRHIEAAYIAMYERHQAGLAPDHIRVPN
jgi:predicted O-linked N-acetylglucosamine transferase (SPINDLY family)